jgi:hypothetical protein
MPVIKEWTCADCGHEYERIKPVCTRCGSHNGQRAFRTPPSINGGFATPHSAKRIDASLQYQFDKLGVTNFRTMEFGRPNRVEWRPYKPAISGEYAGGGQPVIQPAFGPGQLPKLGFNPASLEQSRDTPNGPWTVQYNVPADNGAYVAPGAGLGHRPTELYKHTNVIGGIDADATGTIHRVK